jgi:hypothetical protein
VHASPGSHFRKERSVPQVEEQEVVTADDWPDGATPVYRTETERLAAKCREHAPKKVKLKTYADSGTAARNAGTFAKSAAKLTDGVYEFRADGLDVWGYFIPDHIVSD